LAFKKKDQTQPMNLIYHILISKYFATKPLYLDEPTQKKPNTRKLVEQPWQQTKAEMWDEITETLCNLDFIQAKAAAKKTFELVNDFNEALQVIPDNAENIRQEKLRQERMDKYTRDLILYAKREIKMLDSPECIIPFNKEQAETEINRIKNYPNRADNLKAFVNFLGLEANNLQNYAIEIPYLAIQQAWNYAGEGPVGIAAESGYPYKHKSLILRSKVSRPPWNPYPKALQVLNGHSASILAVFITPDCKSAISSSFDGTNILWDLNTGMPVKTFTGHVHNSNGIPITPDGKMAVTISEDNNCILWDLMSGKPVKTIKLNMGTIESLSITPAGDKAIAINYDQECVVWDLNTGKSIQNLKRNELIQIIKRKTKYKQKVFFSAYGTRAVSLFSPFSIQTGFLWDIIGGNVIKTLKGYYSEALAVSVSDDSKRVISIIRSDKSCHVWDLIKGKKIQILKGHTSAVCSASITPDGKRAITGSEDGTCIVWDLTTGKVIQTLKGHYCHVWAVYISPDGKMAISGGNDDRTCLIWDLTAGESSPIFHEQQSGNLAVALTPEGRSAVFGNEDGSSTVKDLASGNTLHTFKEHTEKIRIVTLTPDGEKVLTASNDGKCIVWDLKSGKFLLNFNRQNVLNEEDLLLSFEKTKIDTSSVHFDKIICTPDSNRVLGLNFSSWCILWNLKTGEAIKKLQGYSPSGLGDKIISLTQDGKKAISTTDSNNCILWELENGRKIHILKGHNHSVEDIIVTPDGKRAISGSRDRTIILWDLITGEPLQKYERQFSWVNAVSITPDGRKIICHYFDNSCIGWDLVTGEKLITFKGHERNVFGGFIFINYGERIISNLDDKTCILWDIKNGEVLAVLISRYYMISAATSSNVVVLLTYGEEIIYKINKELLYPARPIVTIRRIWDFNLQYYLEETADCQLCGHRFSPPVSVLDTIEGITKKAGLRPEQSPCLELPDEYWEDPGLLGNCPKCGEGLKFNPFIAGGE
jgi:WD40 repeat protein